MKALSIATFDMTVIQMQMFRFLYFSFFTLINFYLIRRHASRRAQRQGKDALYYKARMHFPN